MSDQTSGSGFDPRVWGQLNNAAAQASQRSRGRPYGRGRSNRQGFQPRANQAQYAAPMSPDFQSPPPTMDAFPPLGMQQSHSAAVASPPLMSPVSPQSFSRPQSRGNAYSRPYNRNFSGPSHPHYGHSQQYSQAPRSAYNQSFEDYRRPAAPGGQLYQPSSVPQQFGGPFPSHEEKEKAFRKQVMAQSDYLNHVQAATRQKYQLKKDEQLEKEAFRQHLQDIFQELLLAKYHSTAVEDIRLRCYGSLNNGFGLANCDMDLLLSLPEDLDLINKTAVDTQGKPSAALLDSSQKDQSATPQQAVPSPEINDNSKFDVALLLEGALLDLGIGARLLTKTRVPILRVCERPNPELLQSLRNYRNECQEAAAALKEKVEEASRAPPDLSVSELSTALEELADESGAASVALPVSPPKTTQASLEFTGDRGIQCDINFTNFVAIHNTRLLREYCQYDTRVAELGTFVKSWAKLRDINTPYLGTLSSYGYVLLVLHYLMNVAHPPVIPNLQHLAQAEASWDPQPVEKFEGKYDIRFWNDPTKVQEHKAQQPRNHESTGNLLRGFFWYYSAREGFNFKNDVISIRTPGGILKKQNKGWTEAKWSDDKRNVRQRYLLAIEDPFEVDHNIARVVGHNGIVAIRDEFRRAWSIITSIGGPSPSAEGLLDPMEARGDLLRKDQEHHREKIRKLKQELEAKEKQALSAVSVEADVSSALEPNGSLNALPQEGEKQENGTFTLESKSSSPKHSPKSSPHRRRPNSKLTQDVGVNQAKNYRTRRSLVRRVKEESDDEDEDEVEVSTESEHREPNGRLIEQDRRHKAEADNGADNLSGKQVEDAEPIVIDAELGPEQGFDKDGNLVAWDITHQDGRWLHWRDNKIRQCKWKGTTNAHLADYDLRHPYDSRRPLPDSTESYFANDMFWVKQAPYPMNRDTGITSTDVALAAGVLKFRNGKLQTGNRRIKKDSKSNANVPETDPVQATLNAVTMGLNAVNSNGRVGVAKKASIVQGRDFSTSRRRRRVAEDAEDAAAQPQEAAIQHSDGHVEQSDWATSWTDPVEWSNAYNDEVQQSDPWTEPVEATNDWTSTVESSATGKIETSEKTTWFEHQAQAATAASQTVIVEEGKRDDRHAANAIGAKTYPAGHGVSSSITNPYPDNLQFARPDAQYLGQHSGYDDSDKPWTSQRSTTCPTVVYHDPRPQKYSANYGISAPMPAYGVAEMNKRSDEEAVGLPIGWDNSTAGGRWLRERDNWVRMGRFRLPRHHNPKTLHKMFPYDSTRPMWKLREYNAQLRTYYQHSLRPTDAPFGSHGRNHDRHIDSVSGEAPLMQVAEAPQDSIRGGEWPWRQYSLSDLLLPTSKAVDSASSVPVSNQTSDFVRPITSESDKNEEMPDRAFIRNRRLAFFAEQERRESGRERVGNDDQVTTITTFMQRAGIVDRDIQQTVYGFPSLPQAQQQQTTFLHKSAALDAESSPTPEQGSFTSSYKSKGDTEVTKQEANVSNEAVKVPLTLFPNVPDDQRPRDEDPRIMPIPRELGFKFDLRQLRDLAVIQEGGNGCAKRGCEFEIMDEHDFRRSGAVDDMSSTQGFEAAESDDEADEENPYEYEFGMGDNLDLLDELPGPDV